LHFEPTRGTQKMPLLFYFPLIVWMGMMEIAQDEMRVPVRVKARTSSKAKGITPARASLR
jgi:hypothetical protein